MSLSVKIKNCKSDAHQIRLSVFVAEQKYEVEFDDYDNICEDVVIYDDGKAVGTGRYFPDPKGRENVFVFGRIAVLKPWREKHIGMAVIAALETAAKLKGGEKAVLLAKESAIGFYEKCGFTLSEAPVDYCEGQPNRWMEKNI